MKSGTNWLCRILNCHADINCIGEFHWESFFQALDNNVERIAPNRRNLLDDTVRPEVKQMVQRCLIQLAGKPVIWIGDRTPTTIAPIAMDSCPHFVMVRDFRDVIVSRMFHLYNHPRVTRVFEKSPVMARRLAEFQKNKWYFRDHADELLDNEEIVRDSAREWKSFIESDDATIKSNPDLQVCRVRYEELHCDFESVVQSLFQFLGLDVPKLKASVTPGHDTEDPAILNRKGIVGDWEKYMTDQVKSWINEEIFESLESLSIVHSVDW